MSYTVSEIAGLSGVSVRTLHYYDEIGLLSPIMISETGYRYYNDSSLEKLQQIMFYKELDFSLKEIGAILGATGYQKEDALNKQRELLILKRDRLDRLIALLSKSLKGEKNMSFEEFDISEIEKAKEKHAKEVRERWGNTDAYSQSQKKTSSYKKEDWERINKKSGEIFKKFADNIGEDPTSPKIKAIVKEWQDFITEYYYDCTDEILKGLGEMYVADERYKKNLDKYGDGTAEFMSRAIKEY